MKRSSSLEPKMIGRECGGRLKMRETTDGVILELHVKPNSRQFRIQTEDDELVVFCREAPVGGRVNRELMKELARVFHKRVEILSGYASRQKRVLVRDAGINEVSGILSGHL